MCCYKVPLERDIKNHFITNSLNKHNKQEFIETTNCNITFIALYFN